MRSFKPPAPEAFPEVDLSAAGITLPADSTPELVGHGWNSSAWQVGSRVVKVTSESKSDKAATKLYDKMQREHELLARFLGDYMPETEYSLAPEVSSGKLHVVTEQPFVHGTSLPVFLSHPENPTEPLREFLAKSLTVFHKARRMPDIACIEEGFKVFRNSNILIREEADAQPALVDTTFGKTQRSKTRGWLWTILIYNNTDRALYKLDQRQW